MKIPRMEYDEIERRIRLAVMTALNEAPPNGLEEHHNWKMRVAKAAFEGAGLEPDDNEHGMYFVGGGYEVAGTGVLVEILERHDDTVTVRAMKDTRLPDGSVIPAGQTKTLDMRMVVVIPESENRGRW